MGRGAGNCHLEALLGYFNGKKYHVEPVLDLVGSDMLVMKDQEPTWGYNTSYLIAGLANAHPRDAIAATKKKILILWSSISSRYTSKRGNDSGKHLKEVGCPVGAGSHC